jgi:N-formylmaleamate deformylase
MIYHGTVEWIEGFAESNGIRAHYARTGGMHLPKMLLLHGLTDNGACWTRVARELSGSFDIVMSDARGHGRTGGPVGGFTIPLLAADAAGIIRALGLGRPFVFGHSMGAITAAVLAADHPDCVRAVVLEDPPLMDAPPPGSAGEAAAGWKRDLAALKVLSADERFQKIRFENPGWDESEITPLVDAKAQMDAAVLDRMDAFHALSWRAVCARIACPALLLTGECDAGALVTPEAAGEAARLAARLQTAHIRGAGHCIHRDRFPEAMSAVRRFLERSS